MQTIHIRFMQGKDVTLSISSQHTIAHIKQQLLSQLNQENKLVRLIYRGQLLKEDQWTLSDYKNISTSQPIYIHCILSEPCHHEIMANTPSMTHKNRGFDKLREFGYNEEEIHNIRNRFHPSRSTLDYVDEESLTLQHLEREEEWLQTTGNRIPEEGKC
ncbi:hypothetical protein RMCBS344292_03167 [Rhizopus microsporus]|nr:hypothetical protein RMCBS344292_03167 [Rhizopus microsporus]